ncbi:hypothetical protein BC941DRAFT_51502 [Chlamydoabsidia padenii]|nr:hypothetical protein BC941DRAFT_51502 [Chlamydoabsidia padenii]
MSALFIFIIILSLLSSFFSLPFIHIMTPNVILDSLNEFEIIPIQDIQAAIISSCKPLEEPNYAKEEAEEDSMTTYCTSLVHLLLSSTSLGKRINNTNLTINNNDDMDLDTSGNLKNLGGMNYMDKSLRYHQLVPLDFNTVFVNSYRSLCTLTLPLWPRHHQQSWVMHEKTKLLPMIQIPCILDKDGQHSPVSLIAQDHLRLRPTDINQVIKLGNAFYTDALFDMKHIEPLPRLGLKTSYYIPRIRSDRCDGTVPQQSDDNDLDLTLNFFDNIDQHNVPPTTLQPYPALIIPEKRNYYQQQQCVKDIPTKVGTSGYWSKSNKQAPVNQPPQSLSPHQQSSSIVSLSNSLFGGHHSSPGTKSPHTTTCSHEQIHQLNDHQADNLSMNSLSLDDGDVDHDPEKIESNISLFHHESTIVNTKHTPQAEKVFKVMIGKSTINSLIDLDNARNQPSGTAGHC